MIETYWGNYFGTWTPDSATLIEYLATKTPKVELHEIFHELGLEALNGNYTDAELDATIAGVRYHFTNAFHVILDLSILLAQSNTNGLDLASVGKQSAEIVIVPSSKESTQITQALKYFTLMPEAYRFSESLSEEDVQVLEDLVEEVRLKLD